MRRRRKQGKSGQITRMMSYRGGLKLEGKYEDIGIVFMFPLTHFSDIAECAQATATSWASAANTTATKQRRSASSGGKRWYFDPRPVFVIYHGITSGKEPNVWTTASSPTSRSSNVENCLENKGFISINTSLCLPMESESVMCVLWRYNIQQ